METTDNIYRQISDNKERPSGPGWYSTDRGQLFFYKDIDMDEGVWSCRDDKISEEYPNVWYKAISSEVETILKEKEAEIERIRVVHNESLEGKRHIQSRLDAYSELMERMNTTIREVEVMMEQNNMNDNFDGIWRDSDEEILAATKKLQTDFKNLKG